MAVATKFKTFAEMAAESARLDVQEAAAAKKAAASTDFFSAAAPSSQDLLTDIQLRDLKTRQEKLESQMKAAEVYGLQSGEDVTAVNQPKQSFIARGVDILSRPLYGMVGAAKYALGKGEPTLSQSVTENMFQNKETFGTLLRSVGAPPVVSMPIGLALDIIADPVNWLSGGMAGLSRTGLGKIVKGAATSPAAFSEAAKLAGTKAAYNLTKLVPGLNVDKALAKNLEEMVKAGVKEGSQEWLNQIARVFTPADTAVGRLVGKARLGKENLAQSIKEASERYDTLTGWKLTDRLEANATRQSVVDEIGQMARSSDPRVNTLISKVSYSPSRYEEARKAVSAWTTELKKAGRTITQVYNKELGRYESPKLSEIYKMVKYNPAEDALNLRSDIQNLSRSELAKGIEKMADDSADMMKTGDRIEFPSTMYSVDAMNDEARLTYLWNGYNKALAQTMSDEKLKIVEDLQKMITKGLNAVIKNPNRVQQILDGYDVMRGIFVKSKISSLSPSSIIYGSLGNPTMELMYGFDIINPDNYKRLKDALAVIVGTDKKRAKEVLDLMMKDKAIADLFFRRGTDFIDSFGIDLSRLSVEKKVVEDIKAGMTKEEAKLGASLEADKEVIRNVVKLIQPANEMATGATKFFESGLTGFQKLAAKSQKVAKEGTGMKQKAAKVFNAFTERSRDFQKVDQTNKLKTFMRLVWDGVSEKELLRVTNNLLATNARIFAKDVSAAVWKNGKKFYKIQPEKAMEIVNDIYMNYAAMPAFIKTLRSLPIMGAPFYAFTYAMLAKTGKTALNNPAAFNKINFLLQELSQDKSPLEREALKSKYYSYLNTPGMVSLGENMPFFKNHPIYMNLAQMVPYYSLNIMNPSQRGFNDDIRGKFASIIDNLPVFKGPMGQVLVDYAILPAIIRDQAPVNMFGTPLYEKNASVASKIAYAGRSLLESLTPSFPSAVAASTPGLSDEMLKWFPSYPGRKVGFAERGKTAVGVIGNEDPASRGLRAWLSIFGVNLYPIDLVNISNEVKKRVK